MKRMRATYGFTLIELLVVIAIFAVVATAVGASLAGGIRAWDAARDFNAVETDALIDLDILQRDLANTFRFHDIEFAGSKTALTFPAHVRVDDPHGDAWNIMCIGGVNYLYDKEERALFRRAQPYPFPEARPGELGEKAIGNLDAVTFEYYRLAPQAGQPGAWEPEWNDPTNFPARVRVNLVFGEDARPAAITRTIVLPTARREAPRQ